MPNTTAERQVVAVALARGATVHAYDTDLTADEQDALTGLLDHLTRQGVVACFSMAPPTGAMSMQALLAALQLHVGPDVLEATLAAGPPPAEPRPAYLCSIWPFEPGPCLRTTTGQFLGQDLEVFARPTRTADGGFLLTGVEGGFDLYAGPLF